MLLMHGALEDVVNKHTHKEGIFKNKKISAGG